MKRTRTPAELGTGSPDLAPYHAAIVDRLSEILDGRLVGVYGAGSYALGDFDPQRSDVDVFAVARGPIDRDEKLAIADALRHEALPCPARGLEFVLYPEATVRSGTIDAGFALNLNTGPGIPFRLDEEPGTVERHWFPIDRAIVRTRGRALYGPPPEDVFAPIPLGPLAQVVVESLEWHLVPGRSADGDTVLNACRALRWAEDGSWYSKGEAGAWAVAREIEPQLVAAALASRAHTTTLDRGSVESFVARVLAVVSGPSLGNP